MPALLAAMAVALGLGVALAASPPAAAAGYAYLESWGSGGSEPGQIATAATGVAVDPDGGVWALSNADARVLHFDAAGAFLGEFASGADNPYGLATDADGNVYVPDWGNSRVLVFDATGGPLLTIGTPGSGEGELNHPIAVEVAANGEVYVADSWNSRVLVFDQAGAYVRQIGEPGAGDGQFVFSAGIGFDDAADEVYVVDYNNGRVEVFTTAGVYLRQFGTNGAADAQLFRPYGVALDGLGQVIVADTDNNRLALFTKAGDWVRAVGGPGTGPGLLAAPYDVAVDADGDVFVANGYNRRVDKFVWDDTPPEVTSDADTGWHSQDVTVSLSAGDDVAGVDSVEYRLDGGEWVEGASVVVDAPSDHSADGVHLLEFRATDLVGNTSAVGAADVNVDTTAPQTTVSGAVEGQMTRADVTLQFQATDDGAGVATILAGVDGAPLSEVTGDLLLDTEGAHTIVYGAVDDCVDVPNAEAQHTLHVTIDRTAPRPVPLNNVTVRRYRKATFKFNVRDALAATATAKLVIRKNGRTVKTIDLGTVDTGVTVSKAVKISLKSGTYVWKVRAIDPAGNRALSPRAMVLSVRRAL